MDTFDALAPADPDGFAAVVALKAGDAVKSRLGVLTGAVRQQLAWAMALDTLEALAAAAASVVVVSDRTDLSAELHRAGISARVVPEPGSTPPGHPHAGLNSALQFGAELLRAQRWSTVLACVGDLPALRPGSLASVVEQLRSPGRGFVADRSGFGTTVVAARRVPLDPRFGGPSAQAHERSGATPLRAPDDVRSDVDTITDLARVLPLGVGPRTATFVASSAEISDALGEVG